MALSIYLHLLLLLVCTFIRVGQTLEISGSDQYNLSSLETAKKPGHHYYDGRLTFWQSYALEAKQNTTRTFLQVLFKNDEKHLEEFCDEVFTQLDDNKDGFITEEDFADSKKNFHFQNSLDEEQWFAFFNPSGERKVTRKQYLEAMKGLTNKKMALRPSFCARTLFKYNFCEKHLLRSSNFGAYMNIRDIVKPNPIESKVDLVSLFEDEVISCDLGISSLTHYAVQRCVLEESRSCEDIKYCYEYNYMKNYSSSLHQQLEADGDEHTLETPHAQLLIRKGLHKEQSIRNNHWSLFVGLVSAYYTWKEFVPVPSAAGGETSLYRKLRGMLSDKKWMSYEAWKEAWKHEFSKDFAALNAISVHLLFLVSSSMNEYHDSLKEALSLPSEPTTCSFYTSDADCGIIFSAKSRTCLKPGHHLLHPNSCKTHFAYGSKKCEPFNTFCSSLCYGVDLDTCGSDRYTMSLHTMSIADDLPPEDQPENNGIVPYIKACMNACDAHPKCFSFVTYVDKEAQGTKCILKEKTNSNQTRVVPMWVTGVKV